MKLLKRFIRLSVYALHVTYFWNEITQQFLGRKINSRQASVDCSEIRLVIFFCNIPSLVLLIFVAQYIVFIPAILILLIRCAGKTEVFCAIFWINFKIFQSIVGNLQYIFK